MTDTNDTTEVPTGHLTRSRKHIATDWVGVGGHTVRCKCGEWAMTGGRLRDLKREHRAHRRAQGEYAAPERPSFFEDIGEMRKELVAAQELIEELLGEHVDQAAYQEYKNREAHLQALLRATRGELGQVSVALSDQRLYCAQLQGSINACSGNHEDIMGSTYSEKVSGEAAELHAPDMPMDQFEADDDVYRRWGSDDL